MSEIEYKIRKDGNPVMFAAESESEPLDTDMVLDEYPYIQEAMYKENYRLKNLLCMVFDEIVFENKVVGFATYDIRDNFEFMMTECYILPEFRGKRLFFDEICKMHLIAPRFGILQPTRNVIELLLDYAFAKYATENIVVSAIDLYLDPFDVKSDDGEECYGLHAPPSNFYDFSICSTLFIHNDEVFYHSLLNNDCLRGLQRKKLDADYFDNIRKVFSKNCVEFEKLIGELKKELPSNNLGYDVIVGYGEGLSEYMQGMVDENIISYERAVEIREQLIKEYQSGEIDDSNIEERFDMLSLSQEVIINDFNELKDLVNSGELYDESGISEFLVAVAGDDDKFGNELLNAVSTGNGDEFQDLMFNHLELDEAFLKEILDFDEYAMDYERSVIEIEKELQNKYRLDDTNYKGDYPTNYDWEIYTVLHALNYGDNYYDALTGVYFDSLVSLDELTNLLIKSEFIKKDGIIKVDWVNDKSNCPVPYLKRILNNNGLETEGTKDELIKRLVDNNVTLGDSFNITSKGKNHLKKFVWIGYYEHFLYEFDFIDFCRYRESHQGNIKEISLSYLDEHIKLAKESSDEYYLEECLDAKEEILEEADMFLSDLNTLE